MSVSVDLNNAMKKTLEDATAKYDQSLHDADADTNTNQAHILVTINTHGQFLSPKYNKINLEMYITYPYMQDLFHAVQRFCKTLKKYSCHRELSQDYERIFRHPKDTEDKREMDTLDKKILIENP